MFNWIAQTVAVTALNLRTIPRRLGSTGVAIVGIAGVVVVFVSVLSIAAGFTAAMRGSGSPTRALVMRSGADSEMTSGLSRVEVDVIKQAPGLRRDGNTVMASAELYVIIDLPKIGFKPSKYLRYWSTFATSTCLKCSGSVRKMIRSLPMVTGMTPPVRAA